MAGPPPTLGISSPGEQAKPGIYLVDKPGGPPVGDRIGRRAMAFDTTETSFIANLMNFNLGGNFNSRINLNLQEDKGLHLWCQLGFQANPEAGSSRPAPMCAPMRPWMPSASSSREMDGYRKSGPTPVSWPTCQRRLPAGCALLRDPGAEGGFLPQMIMYDLKPDYVRAQNNLIKTVSPGR